MRKRNAFFSKVWCQNSWTRPGGNSTIHFNHINGIFLTANSINCQACWMIFLETCQLLLQFFVSTNLQINLCTVITPAFKCYVALRLFSYRPQMTSKMCWDTRRSWECRRCSYHILTSSVIWFRPTTTWNLFLAHSCWKQWMRYGGGTDVDGSCRPWTEVVFRGQKLHCGPWTEVVSHATPPNLMIVKN